MNPGDADRDLVLQFEHVFDQAIEAVGPEVRAGFGLDQLSGDAHPVAALAHRAFEDVAHAKLAADLLHVRRLALVGKTRIAGDDEEPADAGERGNDFLDHAVGEILLLGVAADVLKRQHGDRRLVGERQCGGFGQDRGRPGRMRARRPRSNAEYVNGLGDVLQRLVAEVGDREIEFSPRLGQDGARDADAAGLGHRFEARRDVDPVAEDVVAVDDHVAEIDPDAPFDARGGRLGPIGHRRLPLGGATHRVDDAGELDEQPVAGGLDDAAVMLGNRRIDQPGAQCLHPRQRPFLVRALQLRVARDIGGKDRGELALDGPSFDHRFSPARSIVPPADWGTVLAG